MDDYAYPDPRSRHARRARGPGSRGGVHACPCPTSHRLGERVEVAGYLSVARRWWWTLLAATATAAIAAFVLVSQIAPTYEARTELLVGPYNSDTDTLGAAGRLVQTYAELVVTEPLLESAIAET